MRACYDGCRGSPGVPLRCHICLPDCSNVPDGDDILHLKRVKQRGREAPGWSDNLKEASGMEELRRLAARSDAAARGEAAGREEKKRPREEAAGEEEKIKDSSESSEVRKKKKKRAFKPAGKKEHAALYKGTGLDQDARTRKKVSRLARRAMKRRSKSSSSSGASSISEAAEGMEDLFQESQRTQLAAKAGPGALAYHAIRQMRNQMLQEQGHETAEGAMVGPVGLQFYRQILRQKMTPVMSREALNISAALDALLSCQPAYAADVLGSEIEITGKHGQRIVLADSPALRSGADGLRTSCFTSRNYSGCPRESGGAEEPQPPEGELGQLLEGRQERIEGREGKRQREEQRWETQRRRQRSRSNRQSREVRRLEEDEISEELRKIRKRMSEPMPKLHCPDALSDETQNAPYESGVLATPLSTWPGTGRAAEGATSASLQLHPSEMDAEKRAQQGLRTVDSFVEGWNP